MNRSLRAALGCPTHDWLRPAQSREGRGHGHRGSCALLAAFSRRGSAGAAPPAGDGRRSGLVRCRSGRRLIAFGPVDTLLGHAIDHPSAGTRTLTQSRSWWGCGRPVGLCSVIPPTARGPVVFTRALEHLLGHALVIARDAGVGVGERSATGSMPRSGRRGSSGLVSVVDGLETARGRPNGWTALAGFCR